MQASEQLNASNQADLAPATSGKSTADRVKTSVIHSEFKCPLVAIYCGSRVGHDARYAQSARHLATGLAQAGFGLVYGGASIGLMGVVADAFLAAGRPVVGIIPNFILDHEIAHVNLTELKIVDSMHTRKAAMADYASAFIALPGGLGTLEELTEIATWYQLERHAKPMLLLNEFGYFNGLISQLSHAVAEGFMHERYQAAIQVMPDTAHAIDAIRQQVALYPTV